MRDAATRPEPGRAAPAGFHFEAAAEDNLEWRVPPIGAGRCRYTVGPGHRVCGKPPMATLMRGRFPYDYCGEHLYGRWLEDGRVMHWRLVPDAD